MPAVDATYYFGLQAKSMGFESKMNVDNWCSGWFNFIVQNVQNHQSIIKSRKTVQATILKWAGWELRKQERNVVVTVAIITNIPKLGDMIWEIEQNKDHEYNKKNKMNTELMLFLRCQWSGTERIETTGETWSVGRQITH